MPPATPAENSEGTTAGRSISLELLHILRLPLRILLTGAAIAAVLGAGVALGLPGPEVLFAALAAPGASGLPALIGMMIFLIGIGFAAFLWWLAARSFALGQLFGGAAGDLRIGPGSARAEIKAENAGDDAIHIAGNR
ncbi:MAG: hypothetical protein ACK5X9_11985, partial [Alphaproteobacteria bacterium]